MSLKSFHILFIIIATSFCLGFFFWTMRAKTLGIEGIWVWGALSLIFGLILIPYLKWFIKKYRTGHLLRNSGKYLGCAVCFASNSTDPNAASMGNAFTWGALLLLGATMGILGAIFYSVVKIEKRRTQSEEL
jgi:hypothetical protein